MLTMAPMHPNTQALLDQFSYEHLAPDLQEISKPCHELAHAMAAILEGPELTAGLRKLREAKDCFVHARLATKRAAAAASTSG